MNSGSGGGGDSRSGKPYPDNYGTLGGSSRKPLKSGAGGYSMRGGGSSGTGGSGGGGGCSGGGGSTSEGSKQPKKAQASNIQHTETKYNFPVKRIFLTRDPEDRSVGGNGLGMKIVGGKEIPGSNGQLGAFVARIYPGGVVDTFGDINENDQILEWNGISLNDKTFEEVQNLISQSKGDTELVVKSSSNSSHGANGGDRTGGGGADSSNNSPLLTSSKSSPRHHFLPSSNVINLVDDLELIGPSAPHSNSSSYDNLSSTTIDM
ncbi:hypothetical protein B566_EDAN013286 [Ephemera danica]|nr:hypothetical protein B566_EDAN013286 [Ephemera danica]